MAPTSRILELGSCCKNGAPASGSWQEYHHSHPDDPTARDLSYLELLSLEQETLLNLVDLTYELVNSEIPEKSRNATDYGALSIIMLRRDELASSLAGQGWRLYAFDGVTAVGKYDQRSLDWLHLVAGLLVGVSCGQERNDIPGIVAHHPGKKLLCIAYHGSRSDACWTTNFDSHMITEEDYLKKVHNSTLQKVPLKFVGGGNLPRGIGFHAGFVNHFLSSKNNLRNLIESLDVLADAEYRIIFTGHSLGAAVAHLSAIDFALEYAPKVVDPSRIGGYFLSTPGCLSWKQGTRMPLFPSSPLPELNMVHHAAKGDFVVEAMQQIGWETVGFWVIQDLATTLDNAKRRSTHATKDMTKVAAHFGSFAKCAKPQFDSSLPHRAWNVLLRYSSLTVVNSRK